jgi:putative ATP-dependent endonuclease of OLD family
MILTRLQIINYKSCNDIYFELEKDNPNILIGINDSGKSTILNAVGLLLDDKQKFNFLQDDKVKKDISNSPLEEVRFNQIFEYLELSPLSYSKTSCYVIGEFQLEENDINDELSTHLQWVLDKNDVEKIWLAKVFDNSNNSSIHYVLTPQGIDDRFEYYKEKATALSKIAKDKKLGKPDNENNAADFQH